MLTKCCSNVSTEPALTALSGETFKLKSTAMENDARPDIAASGLWTKGSLAYADVRIFNPLARSYRGRSLDTAYRQHEREKKNKYLERIINVQHGTFTPLVFTVFGGMSHECTRYYNWISDLLAEKTQVMQAEATNFVHTQFAFCLLRSVLLSVRGSRGIPVPGGA